MTLTDTALCNMALDLLKEAVLTDVNADDTRVSRWFLRNLALSRDAELEAHPWRFAMTRVAITADVTAPAFGWKYRYALPATFMRVGYLNYDGDFEADPIPHEIEGADEADEATAPKGWLLTDQSSTIYLVYVRQITEAEDFTMLFAHALAGRMAMQMSHWLTGKQSTVQLMAAAYDAALKAARRANALLSTPERPYSSDVIAARYNS